MLTANSGRGRTPLEAIRLAGFLGSWNGSELGRTARAAAKGSLGTFPASPEINSANGLKIWSGPVARTVEGSEVVVGFDLAAIPHAALRARSPARLLT